MNYYYLAIDFGESHIGIAVSIGILATPLEVFDYPQGNYKILKEHLLKVVNKINPVVILIGVLSNEKSTLRIKEIFLNIIFSEEKLKKKIIWSNEDYSTKEAILLKRRKKIREDSIAASIILQNYLMNL